MLNIDQCLIYLLLVSDLLLDFSVSFCLPQFDAFVSDESFALSLFLFVRGPFHQVQIRELRFVTGVNVGVSSVECSHRLAHYVSTFVAAPALLMINEYSVNPHNIVSAEYARLNF